MSRRRIMDDPIIISTQTNAPVMKVLWDKGSYKENTFSASEAADKDDTYFRGLFKDNTEIEYFDEWENFTGLTNINYGNNNGYGCFNGAINLKHIKIPRTIIDLGNNCFMNCKSLENITIPNSVLYFGRNYNNNYSSGTFAGCSSLTEVYIPDSVLECSQAIFSSCTNLKRVRWGSNLRWYWYTTHGNTYSYNGCFDNCINLEWIDNLPEIDELPFGCFENCTKLKDFFITV